uniref:Uncharacterized protein LOC111104561 n=1 Tax=Crassostrea virginica TaxID=6565 RepID=A0A8B8AT83_CRAVI|nr:uncharacterized protein LOC111104561 [Crassostrea virginica]
MEHYVKVNVTVQRCTVILKADVKMVPQLTTKSSTTKTEVGLVDKTSSPAKDGSPTLTPESSVTKTAVDLVDETSSSAKDCSLGYTGNRCELQCRYPGFGKDCQSVCNCPEKLCNHITGCHENVCASKKDSSHDVMVYSIVIGLLLLLTIIQFSVYFYLLYCFRTGRIFMTFSFKV